jgi:hypothetical protein
VLLAACVSDDVETDLAATPETIRLALAGDDLVGFVMSDGELKRLLGPRQFGELICPEDGTCVRAADVAFVRVWESRFNPAETAAVIAGAPVYGPFLAFYAAFYDPYGPPRPPDTGDPATAWMRGTDTRGRFDYPPAEHPCFDASSPARLSRTFATDEEAVRWIYDNRYDVGGYCLMGALPYARGVWRDRKRSLELWALGTARVRWEGQRCAPRTGPIRFGPPGWSDLRPGEGDPAVLELINRVLADPRTYATPAKADEVCRQNGALPETLWPELEAEMRQSAADFDFRK